MLASNKNSKLANSEQHRPYKTRTARWLTGSGVIASSLLFSAQSFAAQCEYIISNEWNSGFTGAVRITNNGTTPINGWDVSWQYAGDAVTSSWNANVSGSNPVSATPLKIGSVV